MSQEDIPLNHLIQSYLNALEQSSREPMFSVKGFVMLYLKLFWWEINICLLPFILIINGCIFVINFLKERKLEYIKSVAIKYLVESFQSLKSGEISAFKFFTVRFLIRLLVHSHIKTRLSQIERGLSFKEISYNLDNNSEKIESIKKQKVLLKYFNTTLLKDIQIKILVSSLTPVFGVIAAAYNLFKKDLDLNKIERICLSVFHKENIIGRFIGSLLFFFVVSIISFSISCFIRKREIFIYYGIYEKENLLSVNLRGQLKKEFPYDLLGWIIIIIVTCSNNARFLYNNGSDEYMKNAISLIFFVALFIYAWIRRTRLNNL
jgi:hypothetical protein